ncbi:larval cuticle protein A2B-like [Anopheles darlingi]|uniref:larval cuticle protein A2B-like n=1 Tax=Anopheles darlingi TaxID=43151 RepID=UPI002100138D|nr:larval cuticle protein A2B-like [Anopheles darlingi]
MYGFLQGSPRPQQEHASTTCLTLLFSLSQIVVVIALIAAVSAQSYHDQHQQSHYQPQHYHHEEEHHGPVHYEYHYDVHDDHTGDVHGQKEARKDDSTQGEYYLIDADGHKRTVKYHVEGKSGFIAEVHREPVKGYQAPQPQHHHQAQHHHAAPVHQNYHY